MTPARSPSNQRQSLCGQVWGSCANGCTAPLSSPSTSRWRRLSQGVRYYNPQQKAALLSFPFFLLSGSVQLHFPGKTISSMGNLCHMLWAFLCYGCDILICSTILWAVEWLPGNPVDTSRWIIFPKETVHRPSKLCGIIAYLWRSFLREKHQRHFLFFIFLLSWCMSCLGLT